MLVIILLTLLRSPLLLFFPALVFEVAKACISGGIIFFPLFPKRRCNCKLLNWRGEKSISSKKKKHATKSKIKMYWSRFDIVHSKLELNGLLPKLSITFFRTRRIYFEFYDQAGKSRTRHNVKNNNKLSARQQCSNWWCLLTGSYQRDGLFGKLGIE